MATYESETWLIAAGGLLLGVVGLCCKYIYKIKIADCGLCWGFVSIKRDVDDELKAAAVGDIENKSDDTIPSPTSFPATHRRNNFAL